MSSGKRKATSNKAVANAKKQRTSTSKGHTWSEKGSNFIKGRWTKAESEVLKKTIHDYAASNNVAINLLSQRKVQSTISEKSKSSSDDSSLISKNAWVEIANNSGLVDRTLQSIYAHGCRICDPNNYKGKWTEAEVQKLKSLVSKHGNKSWGLIAAEIGRERRGVQQKYQKILAKERVGAPNSESNNTGKKWEAEEIKILMREVRANCNGGGDWPANGILWTKVAASLKGRKITSMRKKWISLYTAEHKWTVGEESALAQAVTNCNAASVDDVPWMRLGDAMVGDWPKRAGQQYRLKYDSLRKRTGKECSDPNTPFRNVVLAVNAKWNYGNAPVSSSSSSSSSSYSASVAQSTVPSSDAADADKKKKGPKDSQINI